MSKTFERRMGATVMELREASDQITLSGYASTYNEPYSMGWYTETVAPGAFRRSLGTNPDVRLLINHGGLPLARTTSGTLTLDGENDRGLHVQAGLDPSDPDVRSLVPKMRRGDLNGMSFTFGLMGSDADEWSKDMSQRTMRNLEINDGDVSVVTYPANHGSNAALDGVRADGPGLDAINSAMRALSSRDAPTEDVESVLSRALGYFTAVGTRAAPVAADPETPAEDATECGACDTECCDCTDPDCDGTCCPDCPAAPMRAAQSAKELRGRLLALIG